MFVRNTLVATLTSVVLLSGSGFAAAATESGTVGQYVDDAAITTAVKTRFMESKDVAATSIKVETLNGTVQLSGFAKSEAEKAAAEALARKVSGVKEVKNSIAVQPSR